MSVLHVHVQIADKQSRVMNKEYAVGKRGIQRKPSPLQQQRHSLLRHKAAHRPTVKRQSKILLIRIQQYYSKIANKKVE